MSFSRTLEKALQLERKIRDTAANPDIPGEARWMEVHWNRVKLYELVIEEAPQYETVLADRLLAVADRVRQFQNVRDPHPDHFTERLTA